MSNQWAGIAQAASSIIGTAGGMVQGARNRRAQRKENRAQRQWASDMYDLQNQRDIEFWNMQNQYNDPAAQMQRLKDAGLNPNLVYGNGTTTSAGPIATHSAPQPNTAPERYENELAPLADSIFNYLEVQQRKANISRTEAETQAIGNRDAQQMFENHTRELVGNQNFANMERWQQEIIELKATREGAEWNAFMTGSYTDEQGQKYATDDPNSPISKSIRAGWYKSVVELENAVQRNSLNDAEIAIRSFQASLAKQGISPDTPWYAKIVADLISRATGVTISDMVATPMRQTMQQINNK